MPSVAINNIRATILTAEYTYSGVTEYHLANAGPGIVYARFEDGRIDEIKPRTKKATTDGVYRGVSANSNMKDEIYIGYSSHSPIIYNIPEPQVQ